MIQTTHIVRTGLFFYNSTFINFTFNAKFLYIGWSI
jgi:hypothetical protein